MPNMAITTTTTATATRFTMNNQNLNSQWSRASSGTGSQPRPTVNYPLQTAFANTNPFASTNPTSSSRQGSIPSPLSGRSISQLSHSSHGSMDSQDSKKEKDDQKLGFRGFFRRSRSSSREPPAGSSPTSLMPPSPTGLASLMPPLSLQEQAQSQYNEPPPSYDSIDKLSPAPAPNQASSSSQSQAYSNTASSPRTRSPRPASILSTEDDEFAFLSDFDTVFVIDDSWSMKGSRWKEVEAVLRLIAPICAAHDDDGLDVYFLNHKPKTPQAGGSKGKGPNGYYGIKTAKQVQKTFKDTSPEGSTKTGSRLRGILMPYIQTLKNAIRQGENLDKVRPINVIVITDGCPTDDLNGDLMDIATELDRIRARSSQVGIQFFQVGNDTRATRALKSLDDNLGPQNNVRDMIDTVTWDGARGVLTHDTILKTVLGAVSRRLDAEEQSNRQ